MAGKQTVHSLRAAFNNRSVTWLCLLLAVLNKSLIAWLYSDLSGDKALYLLFTAGFLKTGIGAEEIKIAETGAAVYLFNPAIYSPLYALLCAPLLWLTKSFFATQLLASIFGWVLFFTAIYKTATLVLKERWQVNLFIVCVGFFIYPHELFSTPKDTLAIAFSLWCTVFIVQFIRNKPDWLTTVFLTLSIACIGLTKLLYTPLVVVLLSMLLLFLFIIKGRKYFVHYLVCIGLVLLIAFGTWLLLLQPTEHFASVNPIIIPTDGTKFISGFYPKNLLHIYPFISSAVINTDFWGAQLDRLNVISFSQTMNAFRAADVFILLLLLLLLATNIKRIHFSVVHMLLIVAAATLAGTVIYLSLTTKAFSFISDSGTYTYVSEGRSFLLPILTLQLLIFYFVFCSHGAKALKILLLLFFLLECFHGFYFTVKQTINANEVSVYKKNDDAIKQVTGMVLEKTKKEKNLSLITTDRNLRRYAVLQGVDVYSFTNVPMNLSWMKKRDTYIVVTHTADSVYLKKLPAAGLKAIPGILPYVLHRFDVP